MGIDTQNFYPTTHWFVPLNELDAEAGAPLRPADLKPSAAEPLANEGDSFLVTLESLLIVKKYDRKSDNDLLVRSRLKYGNDAIVESINFFENDVPAGVVRNNLLCEYIYSQDHYSKLDRVHLEIEVMELPGDISLDKSIAKGLSMIKNTFGVVLSSFLPFGGVAFDVMKKVNSVRSEKRQIFLSKLDLYGEGGEGEARLRYGAYIFFKEPIDASPYKLHKLEVKHLAPADAAKPLPHDYIVVKVVQAPIRVGSSEEIALNNQKLAASLGTPDGQMDVNADWQPNFDRIIPDAEKLRKLAIFYGLKKRQDARETLDDAQTKLYQKLLQELQEFI
ncbi:hypothetical protein [Leptothoe spongobia]|uniref:Uncharacterized protein n=1 Tax=Leptothoe spongobia TAU-MAC 1115 TaxID=1967444 RepID=A0A947DJV6_9CYAN|nr:hypothetical protein [Leptothoe spongobia]MBT9317610.1 hypothetical protein [Leptothoe spongobia TAU-MAC 1115]